MKRLTLLTLLICAAIAAPAVAGNVPTNTAVVSSPNPSSIGQNVTLTATVTPQPIAPPPDGDVNFFAGASYLGTATLNGAGVATLSTSFAMWGNKNIRADYDGTTSNNQNYLSSSSPTQSHWVKVPTTTTLMASSMTFPEEASVTLTATVDFDDDGFPAGTVTFRDGGAAIGSATLVDGQATLVTSFAGGVHTLTAAYGGSVFDEPSTSPPINVTARFATSTTLTSTPNPSVLGELVDLIATVTSNGGTPTGTVEIIHLSGTSRGTGTLNGGQAIIQTTELPAGVPPLVANFGANGIWRGSTSPEHVHQVGSMQPVATSTTLTTSANPILVGSPVTFTAVVTPLGKSSAPIDKGGASVTFRNGGTVIGQGPFDQQTQSAQFTTSSLPVGQRAISAMFTGAPGLLASTSNIVTLGVRVPTITTLVSSLNPAFADEQVLLTATVTSSAGTPAGLAELWVVGVGPAGPGRELDAAGQVKFDVSPMGSVGMQNFQVFYSGDGNRAGSDSNALVQESVDRPVSIALTVGPGQDLAPVAGVDLGVTLTGTNFTPVNYYFYCNRSDPGTDPVGEDWDLLVQGTSEVTFSAVDLCSYANPGSYAPKVIAQTAIGDFEARTTFVATGQPVASFQFSPTTPLLGDPITFTSTSKGPGLRYSWDFNSDGRADSASRNPTWTFGAGGSYRVRLTATNDYGQAVAANTVVVLGAVPEVQVTSVERQYNGSFLRDHAPNNALTVGIDWAGETPGTLRVRINGGAIQTVGAGGGSAVLNLNIASLPARSQPSVIEVTPITAGGLTGRTHREYIDVFPIPGWLSALTPVVPADCSATGGACPGGPPAADEWTWLAGFPFPLPGISGTIVFPDSMPLFAGSCQIFQSSGTPRGVISSTRKTTNSVYGTGAVLCGGGLVDLAVSGNASLDLLPPRGLDLPAGSLLLTANGSLDGTETLLGDALPELIDLYVDPVVGPWVRAIGDVDISGNALNAGLDLATTFRAVGSGNASRLAFDESIATLGLTADRDVKGPGYTGDTGDGTVRQWIAGGGTIELGTPAPFVRSAQVALQFGVTIDIAGSLQVTAATEWSCTWNEADGPDAECMNNGGAKAGRSPGTLTPIERDYAAHGRYAAFEPRRLADTTSVPVPKAVTQTELATNVYPEATPHLTDLGGGDLLLMWLEQDLGDPLLQFTEVAWSRFDGTSWSAPALIADDTRFESGPAASVDSLGRVVAVWQRIKDPAFSTPITTLSDLVLFQSRYEIVTSIYTPGTGTWGAITALTDDDQFDRNARISAGPGGELLLTWLSSSGESWVSTVADSATVKYAFWNPGSSSWGPIGSVGTGLVGVSDYAAAFEGADGVIVLARDPDPLADTDEVIEVWEWNGAAWVGPVTLASGGFGHARPQVQYDRYGDAQVLWLRGVQAGAKQGGPATVRDELVQATLLDPTPRIVGPGSGELGLSDVRLLSDGEGNLTLLWNRVGNGGPAQIHALIYDDAASSWSQDRQLIDESERRTERISAVYGSDGVLRAAYLSTAIGRASEVVTIGGQPVEIPNVPVEGATDLRLLERSLIRDLAVADQDLVLTPAFPEEGDAVTARLTVHNVGEFVIGDVNIDLHVGEPDSGGEIVGQTTLDGPFAAGSSREVVFDFTLPGGGNVIALIDPDALVAELTRVNNRAEVAIGNLAPFAVALADTTSGAFPLVVAFDGTQSFDPEGGVLNYEWVFGDGSAGGTGPIAGHTFDSPGEFVATLIVTDPTGRSGSAALNISVGPLAAGETTDVLGVDKNGGNIVLTWGDSCLASDSDYAIYRGTMGDFMSHTPMTCSTDGLTEVAADPGAGDGYFLIVPRNGRNEGSYGADSAGGPRPVSAENCAPQLIGSCNANCTPLSQWATTALASSEFPGFPALAATGAPDTLACGDLPTAWAPLTDSIAPEFLEVGYPTPVYATGAEIYENFAAGGVYLIEVRDTGGTLRTVWEGIDTTTCEPLGSAVGVLNATWPETSYLVSAIRIHTAIIDYEEIDAVQLNGQVCE